MTFLKKLISTILSAAMVIAVSCQTVGAFYFGGTPTYTEQDGYTFYSDDYNDGILMGIPENTANPVLPAASPGYSYLVGIDTMIRHDRQLRSITFPENSLMGGEYTLILEDCANLETVNFPSYATASKFNIQFTICPKLKSIRVPDGITELPIGFLYDCPSLKEVYLPASITKIHSADSPDADPNSLYLQDSFYKVPNTTFIVEKGSYADQWFQNHTQFRCRRVNSVSRNGWERNGGGWQYFQNGRALTGWIQVNQKWYYMNPDSYLHTGWLKDAGGWYYCHQSSGEMMTGWISTGQNWYYLSPSGLMTTGWQKSGERWYYLNENGQMLTGWIQSNGVWYYLNSSGAMHTGWLRQGSDWYYCHGESGEMMTGWISVNGKWYYQNSNGKMLFDTITPDGYRVGSDGAMLP